MMRWSILVMLATTSFRSSWRGCITCLRLKIEQLAGQVGGALGGAADFAGGFADLRLRPRSASSNSAWP